MRESNLVELQCAGSGALLNGQKGLFELDPISGYKMRPNLCIRLQSDEYDQVLKTNSHGFAGPEVPVQKSPGDFRIVVLGDSYTAGGQVPYDQNYTALLADDLHKLGYSDVRVINAGVGGCGTFCQLGQLQNNIDWMQPDLIVDSVFVGNNISENVLLAAGGYQAAPWHPKGITWGPKAAELVDHDQSGHWFPRNGLAATEIPPPWDPSQGLPTPVGNTTIAVERTHGAPAGILETRALGRHTRALAVAVQAVRSADRSERHNGTRRAAAQPTAAATQSDELRMDHSARSAADLASG